ncbi:MAG: hypothetical protein QOJ32_2631 [Frankiaceae bacterium]|nr:hypothetical protein [Frankiaceae bacterium]
MANVECKQGDASVSPMHVEVDVEGACRVDGRRTCPTAVVTDRAYASAVLQRRAVIEYALARRATLADLSRGGLARRDACDAHPDLLRAARHHGEATATPCPICHSARPLVSVTYAYGDELGESSGRARAQSELVALSQRHAEIRVFVVEVCRSCCWNHLRSSFTIGTGLRTRQEPATRRPARRRAAGK